ncbi:hypothetical protein [Roseibium alexandrii]|uniref:Uncharacterized protein n=1 Tax=Roseibium alexandrii TaxID=388408 RepID=A0A0M7AEN6_9HYPH|nr:hypothetical protein [Roseibium alexandrii]CTQ73615.1 hypothetical protein LAX5112_03597 [Roseibium alexandrii]
MKKFKKRLDLAAAVLKVTLLVLKNVDVLIELLSKVVNYPGSNVRQLQVLILEKRKTNICAQ